MNVQAHIFKVSFAVLLTLGLAPAMADSHWQQTAAQTDVYGSRPAEPTCCYSPSRLWRNTNTQSGWSVNRSGFDPHGFPQRSDTNTSRPTPLPRDTVQQNPWSVGMPQYATDRDQRQRSNPNGQWANAQYFQPAYYNYPPQVPLGVGGWDPVATLPGMGPWGDPYLGGLMYPGYGASPLMNPLLFGGFYGPGYMPGMW